MLNKHLNLNPKLFDPDVEQAPLRDGFGEGLLEAARQDERIVGLCADLTESTRMHHFKEAFTGRFIEVGITEQHMASCASGMATMGKIPFISSYAMFNPGRNWEQIRTTICYNDMPVKIIGSHSGLSVGADGGTHQALEDIALMRVIPRMEVIAPCDALEAKKATIAIASSGKPSYLRLAREKTPVITTADTPFEIGKAQVLYDSTSVDSLELKVDSNNKTNEASAKNSIAIIAIGPMVHMALLAAMELERQGIGCIVVNSATVKPLDKKTILEVARKVKGVVTAETHQIAGGLGSAVAELLIQEYPKKMAFVGVRDRFGQSGAGPELMEYYGLGVKDIVSATTKLIA